jgi:hypothetical protein
MFDSGAADPAVRLVLLLRVVIVAGAYFSFDAFDARSSAVIW